MFLHRRYNCKLFFHNCIKIWIGVLTFLALVFQTQDSFKVWWGSRFTPNRFSEQESSARYFKNNFASEISVTINLFSQNYKVFCSNLNSDFC